MASTYTGNPIAVQAPAAAPGRGVAPIISLPASADGLDPTSLYQALKVLADYVAWLTASGVGIVYGSGIDGTLAGGFGTMNLTRDVEYQSITMGATDVINTNGFRIRTWAFTGTAGAIIDCSASGTTPGGNGGTFGLGAKGGTSGSGSGQTGRTGFGAAGGAGGAAGGAAGALVAVPWAWRSLPHLFSGTSMVDVGGTGTLALQALSGGSGGGGGSNGGGTGGAGGAGGGIVFVAARLVSGAATFRASGGNGANGVGGTAGGGGGGGGGSGILAYSQGSLTITSSFAGGTGGTGPGGSGGNGSAGPAVNPVQL